MRKHLGKLFLVVSISCIALVALIYRHFDNNIRNAYAQWWVADMVRLHLHENEQQWPRSWNDLRDDYDACVKLSGRPWSFEELSTRVTVDWSVETETLRELSSTNDRPPFRVIWATDGSTKHWQHREPNTMIFEYLKLQSAAKMVRPLVSPNKLQPAAN